MTSKAEKRPYILILALAFLGAALAGCAGAPAYEVDAPPGTPDCEFYPEREYFWKTWSSKANETREGFDVVQFGVERWIPKDDDAEPDFAVDWARFPLHFRPPILADVLCGTKGRIESGFFHPATPPGMRTTTSEAIANSAMAALERERDRQYGLQEDVCCYVLFDGFIYGAGINSVHVTWPEDM